MPMRSTLPATAFAVSLGIGLSVVAGTIFSGAPAVATSVQDASATSTMATCNALTILENMYGSETYSTARDELARRLSAEIEQLQVDTEAQMSALEPQINRLQAEINILMPRTRTEPQDPALQGKIEDINALRRQYNELNTNLTARSREAATELQTFNAEQLIEIYNTIASKATEIAEANGYTHLFMTRTWEQEFDPRVGVTGVIQDILARPLAISPSTNDITQLVRDALNVPEPVEGDAADTDAAAELPTGG